MKKNIHIIIISFIFSVVLWVSISLSNDYYATIDVPLRLTGFPDGYTSGTYLPEFISVKLKAKGWKLVALGLTQNEEYVVPVGNEVGKRTLNLSNYFSDNQWLSSDVEVINFSPDSINFFVEKMAIKKLPIVPNIGLKFKNGYGLASPMIMTPESTIVHGAASFLKDLMFVSTQKIDFDNLDNQITKAIPLEKIPGMVYDNPVTKVYLNIQKIVEKNFDGIRIKVLDVPKNQSILLLPNKISVGVRGGIDILGRLDTSQFNAYINYRDIISDTLGSIVPHVNIPDNTILRFIKPDQVRYIIKKF